MRSRLKIKLPLTDIGKAILRKNKIGIASILNFATYGLGKLLKVTKERAKEIYALAEFQTVPSVGIKFAEDLVYLGYYSLNELKQKDNKGSHSQKNDNRLRINPDITRDAKFNFCSWLE